MQIAKDARIVNPGDQNSQRVQSIIGIYPRSPIRQGWKSPRTSPTVGYEDGLCGMRLFDVGRFNPRFLAADQFGGIGRQPMVGAGLPACSLTYPQRGAQEAGVTLPRGSRLHPGPAQHDSNGSARAASCDGCSRYSCHASAAALPDRCLQPLKASHDPDTPPPSRSETCPPP